MSRLTISIETVSHETEVIATMVDYADVDSVIDLFNELFEVEMIGAEITRGKSVSVIRVVTNNKEKLELLKRASIRTLVRTGSIPEFSKN